MMLIKISFGVIIILLNETIFVTESVEPKKKLDGKKLHSTIRISIMLAILIGIGLKVCISKQMFCLTIFSFLLM